MLEENEYIIFHNELEAELFSKTLLLCMNPD